MSGFLGGTSTKQSINNSYTMFCPHGREDNPRALASGLSYILVDNHGIAFLYHLRQCRDSWVAPVLSRG